MFIDYTSNTVLWPCSVLFYLLLGFLSSFFWSFCNFYSFWGKCDVEVITKRLIAEWTSILQFSSLNGMFCFFFFKGEPKKFKNDTEIYERDIKIQHADNQFWIENGVLNSDLPFFIWRHCSFSFAEIRIYPGRPPYWPTKCFSTQFVDR